MTTKRFRNPDLGGSGSFPKFIIIAYLYIFIAKSQGLSQDVVGLLDLCTEYGGSSSVSTQSLKLSNAGPCL